MIFLIPSLTWHNVSLSLGAFISRISSVNYIFSYNSRRQLDRESWELSQLSAHGLPYIGTSISAI